MGAANDHAQSREYTGGGEGACAHISGVGERACAKVGLVTLRYYVELVHFYSIFAAGAAALDMPLPPCTDGSAYASLLTSHPKEYGGNTYMTQ